MKTFTSKKKCDVHPKNTCDSKSNSMGVDRGRVKKTWLDSTRLSLDKLWSNSMWVSKSFIKITKPWKEGRRASNLASKLFTHTTRKHPKSMWGRNLIQSPNLISFSFFCKNWETFQAKNSATNFFLSFFPPLFFFCFSPFFWVRMRRLIMVSTTNTYWTLVPISDLKRDLEMSSWDLNHLLLLALSLSLSLHLCIQSLLLPTAIAASSTLSSVSLLLTLFKKSSKEKTKQGKELCVASVLVKVEAFFLKAFPWRNN